MSNSSDYLLLVNQLSQAFVEELAHRQPESPIASTTWPTVGALVKHVASIYRWVAEIVSTGAAAPRSESPLADDTMDAEASAARKQLLDALTRAGDDSPCWIIGGHQGTADFWMRRMVFETLKHLIDLRGAGGAPPVPAELTADLAAEGIDEFFDVFLARSRASLEPLPGTLAMVSTDAGRAWTLTADPARFSVQGESAIVVSLQSTTIHR